MITLQLGRWHHKAGRLFIHDRVYTNTGKWTPICVTHFRHVGSEPVPPPPPPEYQEYCFGCGFPPCVILPKEDKSNDRN